MVIIKKIILLLLFSLFNVIFSQDTIFFVYNSKDDFYTIISDTFHKALKPDTYPCQLCKLTYNTVSKKKRWKEYLATLEHESHFFYKQDPFVIDNKITEFPLILMGSTNNYKILLSKDDINQNRSLEELINMINLKLKNIKL